SASDPLHRVDSAFFERRIDITGRELLWHHAEPTDDLAGESPDPELQALQILDLVDFLAKPAAHLAAGLTHWDAVAIEACEYLLQQIVAAAMHEPGFHLPRVETKWHGGAKGERRILSHVVIGRGAANLDGLVLHGVEHRQAGHDLAGSEELDLESAIGDLGDALGEYFTGTV